MPIMDGHESTKSIRSFEDSHASDISVPVIAVSASLVERERDFYMDVGFDGWILKPIPFDRLRHIMSGVADPAARKEDLYKPGCWERGGWFKEALEHSSPEQGHGEDEER
jgi:CheY-like chemotaxis protein